MPVLSLSEQIEQSMPCDQSRLRDLWRRVRRAQRQGKPHDRNLDRLLRAATESSALRARRRADVPAIHYDQDLPILAKRAEIIAAIQSHPVVVVCGETGSGKSTQLPKFCLEAGRGRDGVIGHTQPRRLAARSIAARVAEELRSPLGVHVGYKIRFADETRPETYVKLMTDGILLAETQTDPWFERYDALLIDEAHERSLNVDFLLGMLHRVLARRRDLRVVITSATIDAERFSRFFAGATGPAPIIEASGRSYPVAIRYQPVPYAPEETEPDLCRATAEAVEELARRRDGDVLAFLPTEADIRETARLLRGRLRGGGSASEPEILPLYARLSTAEQNKVFQAAPQGRVVLATNVAESSLTVPRIRYVVDAGLARVSRYTPRSRLQRLPIEPISQASANQRAGRCGRVGPGVCVRLYSESDFATRPRYAMPEIRRTHLAAVILRMLALRLGPIEDFPLLDRPRPEAVQEGWQTLRELQAVDGQGQLTPLGERLSRLPTDPRVGRMILASIDERCVTEVLIIAAALEVQDPRERPAERREEAESCHARFADPRSDFLGLLRLWDFFHQLKQELSSRGFRKACRENYLAYTRLREWQETYRQLCDLVRQSGAALTPRSEDYAAIHRALLTGLLSSIAVRRGPHHYETPSGQGFALWPGAGPFARKPKWAVAAEAVETSRRYLRTVAAIRREWLEPLAAHLVERSYHGPHWCARRQTVLAYERVRLFGLAVAPPRTRPYGPVDPVLAREVFVREALAHEGLQQRFAFQNHNRRLLQELTRIGDKQRSAARLVDEAALLAFYDARLPAGVYDLETFRRWYRREARRQPDLLMLSREELLPAPARVDAMRFPDALQVADASCPLAYRFAPGEDEDGITLVVPRELLPALHDDLLGWTVPGLLEEKLAALIRLLPKNVRTRLAPAPDAARELARHLPFGQGPFATRVAEALSRAAGVSVSPEMIANAALPPHLRLNVRVVDAQGAVLVEGRALGELRQWAGIGNAGRGRYLDHPDWRRTGVTQWDFGDLSRDVVLHDGPFVVTGRPGLIDEGQSVALRLFAWPQEAQEQTRAGVRRLFLLRHRESVSAHVRWLPDWDRLEASARRIPSQFPFAEEVAELLADRALGAPGEIPRTAEQFEAASAVADERLALAVQEIVPVIGPIVDNYEAADEVLRRVAARSHAPGLADVRDQLAELLGPGYLVHTPWLWLAHVPRYLAAARVRLERLAAGGDLQDARMQRELGDYWKRWQQRRTDDPWSRFDERLERYRWMVEEFRVSLFAQQLGTSLKISARRLDEQWELVANRGHEPSAAT